MKTIKLTEKKLRCIIKESINKILKENINANDIFNEIKHEIYRLETEGEISIPIITNDNYIPTKKDMLNVFFKSENMINVEYNGKTKLIPCDINKINNYEYVARCIMSGFAQIYLNE